MKKTFLAVLIILGVCVSGCSTPGSCVYSQLYSITKKEEKKKVAMGGKKKIVIIKDFRLNDVYDEDIAALSEKIEKYISGHPELADSVKSNLRELKVTAGLTQEQVELLLSKPDKVMNPAGSNSYGAGEVWVYRINKARMFSVFIVPVFFVNESYRLFFKDGVLEGIERHYLKQVVKESPGGGLFEKQDEANTKK